MITLIAAIGENYALGLNGKLPWHLPEDFKWFKSKTIDRPVIMGRKTFEALPKLLPGRLHIVISRTQQSGPESVIWVSSLEQAIALARETKKFANDEIMIIGGGDIYSQSIRQAVRMYLTEVKLSPPADAFFPAFDRSQWHAKTIASYEATADKPAFMIRQYDRI